MNSTWNWDSLYTHKIRSHGVLLFKCKETSQFFSRVARIHSCCDFDNVSLFFSPKPKPDENACIVVRRTKPKLVRQAHACPGVWYHRHGSPDGRAGFTFCAALVVCVYKIFIPLLVRDVLQTTVPCHLQLVLLKACLKKHGIAATKLGQAHGSSSAHSLAPGSRAERPLLPRPTGSGIRRRGDVVFQAARPAETWLEASRAGSVRG